MSPMLRAINSHDYFFEKPAQELFAITIHGGRRRPNLAQIGTQSTEPALFFRTECARTLLLPALQFRLGCREIAQPFLPLGFQPARHQPVLGLHGTILAFGALRLVARTFYGKPPLAERGIVIG